MLDKMKALVKQKDICVLATVSGDKPYCSLMAYVTDEDCRKIYMATRKQTSKYKNLLYNPSVSLLIDTREEHLGSRRNEAKALSVTGVYESIEDAEKEAFFRARLLERHPHMREFMDDPDTELFCIRMKSFLLLDGLNDAYFEEI
jgi:nitroimidazol reductase NimA-like FMN-containing flavoprotein (pyridoxamine 5'-phosphate oxidase superfamily)